MALFGKKAPKNNGAESSGDGGESSEQAPEGGFSPQKARAFFDRAQSVHETGNYPYAMQMWLNGLMWDPGEIEGFNGFLTSTDAALADAKKVNKAEIAKGLNGKGVIKKFQVALLDFAFKKSDGRAALKAAEASGELGLKEQTMFLGRVALALFRNDKKQSKGGYVQLMDAFEKAGAFPLAVEAGGDASRLDPSDADLARRVQQLAAQSTISSGGYDDTDKEGGFRKNIRDIEKQTNLEAADSLAKTEDVKDRLVREAEAALQERPDDIPSMKNLLDRLVDRGKKEDLVRAMGLCDAAYEKTGQFSFRERKGAIKIGHMRRQLQRAQLKLEKQPDDALRKKVVAAEEQLMDLEIEELSLQVENYPTDLRRKFALGTRLAGKARHEEAIALFQEAQDDPKIRGQVQYALGASFMALGGWEDSAIQMFESALSSVTDEGSELALDIRYELTRAYLAKGEAEKDLDALQAADKLAGEIAMKKFNFRDVKTIRQRIKELIGELRDG